ncbi:MAG: hypothetical protein ACRC4M_04545 [Mycoplasma sp.]
MYRQEIQMVKTEELKKVLVKIKEENYLVLDLVLDFHNDNVCESFSFPRTFDNKFFQELSVYSKVYNEKDDDEEFWVIQDPQKMIEIYERYLIIYENKINKELIKLIQKQNTQETIEYIQYHCDFKSLQLFRKLINVVSTLIKYGNIKDFSFIYTGH